MQTPLQITFRDMATSEAVEARIREKVESLEHFFPRITACRVVVEAPAHHHRKGAGSHFRITIEVSVPGTELVVSQDKGDLPDHDDVYIALRDAFGAVRRQLQDHAQKLHDEGKHARERD